MSANPDDGAIERAAAEAPARRSPQANTLVIGLGGVLLLAAVGVLAHVLTTRSRDAVVDADFIELASPINGQLDALRVEAGDAVRTGQQLALVWDPRASEADVRRLRTALDTARADLDRLDRQLALERQLAVRFQQDASTYRRLETDRTGNELDQLKAARAREQEEVAFSQRDLQRQETLFRAGAIAETVVDRARTSLQQNRDQLQGIEARIRAQTNRLQAAESDLSLDRTRSSSDPLPRLQQSQLKLAQLEGEQAGSRRRVAGLEAQLITAETLYRQQQQVWLEAPRQAVVWRVQARSGDTLRAQQPVLRLVTCSSRWVNTYVSEADLKRLQIGSRARVDLIGESLDLRGRVDLIRSGVGRLSGRDGEPSALPINLARESQVRVRINSDVPAPPRKLCFVGYSARVIFP